MIDWREYWEAFPQDFDSTDFCRQVGRTANGGRPTGERELRRVLEQVREGLELKPSDRLLDLCCGNGLLTRQMAAHCDWVSGVDFSGPMIRLAKEHHAAPRVDYFEASALDLRPEIFEHPNPFDKVCMFESLQYFDPQDLRALLSNVESVLTGKQRIYLSGVLDRSRIWNFFNTPERRASYEQQQQEGREIMGRWWHQDELRAAGSEHSYECQFIAQDEMLNTAHYRFDALFIKQ